MIRINLLGVPKPKKGKRQAVAVAGEGPNPMLVGVVVLVIAAALMGTWWWLLDQDARKIAADTATAEKEYARLKDVETAYNQKQKQVELYQRRIKVIEDLRAAQSGPVDLLTMIGDTVNATDAVWLNKMNEDGTNVNIEGTALSVKAVANFMANLKRTGKFKTVEMKESYQDETVKDMQAFIFTFTCEKAKS